MKTFIEYLDRENEQKKEKLEKMSDFLKRIDKFTVMPFLNKEEQSYIFVRFPVDSSLKDKLKDLQLGLRIYIIGKTLVYRLQQGAKGFPIGPSKKIEDQEEIEDLVEKGKSEEEAYNTVMKRIPNEFRKFMKQVYKNIEIRTKGMDQKDDKDTDAEKYKAILNSILTSKFDPRFKM